MLCLEWWACDLFNIVAGMISADDLAAYVVMDLIISTSFMIALGVSIAGGALTSDYLGQGKID